MFELEISNKDFGLEETPLLNPRKRQGARGIIINSEGKIAIFNKRAKNEFKLPGGGVEPGENKIEAFKREVMEEAGCEIHNIRFLGTIKEIQNSDNYRQLSFVFVANVLKDLGKLSLTEKERDEAATLIWLEPKEALEKMEQCLGELKASKYDNVYRSGFMVKRDIYILKEFLKDYYKKNTI